MPYAQKALCVAALSVATLAPAHAATDIAFWYSMTGANSDRVQALADQFNKSQSDYKVIATYKGGYDDVMAAAIAAYRAGNAPNTLQVFEVGTATMMHAKGAIVPVITYEELENVWSGKKTAKEALDTAVKRGDEQLVRFEKANR